jgi:hypothetical protein
LQLCVFYHLSCQSLSCSIIDFYATLRFGDITACRLDPILSQLNPVHTPTACFLIFVSMLQPHLSVGLFPLCFPCNMLYFPLPPECYMSCSSYSSLLRHRIHVIKITNLISILLLLSPSYVQGVLLSTLFSNILNFILPLKWDTRFHTPLWHFVTCEFLRWGITSRKHQAECLQFVDYQRLLIQYFNIFAAIV